MSDETAPVPSESSDELDTGVPAVAGDEVTDTDVEATSEMPVVDDDHFNVMSIESVLYDLSDSSPMVHMIEDQSPYRYLAIPIGLPEAVALHNAIDKIDGRRPGTHEVMSEVLRRLNA